MHSTAAVSHYSNISAVGVGFLHCTIHLLHSPSARSCQRRSTCMTVLRSLPKASANMYGSEYLHLLCTLLSIRLRSNHSFRERAPQSPATPCLLIRVLRALYCPPGQFLQSGVCKDCQPGLVVYVSCRDILPLLARFALQARRPLTCHRLALHVSQEATLLCPSANLVQRESTPQSIQW